MQNDDKALLAKVQAALQGAVVHMEYDWPADVPEECGLWCDLCKRHVDSAADGHADDCLCNPALARTVAGGDARIKPLRWQEPHPSHRYPQWHAMVSALRFHARIDTSEPSMYGRFPLIINGENIKDHFDSVDAAKEYAEARYAELVSSLIATPTAPAAINGERAREMLAREMAPAQAKYIRAGGAGDDTEVYCPKCHMAGADCGDATRHEAAVKAHLLEKGSL